MSWIIKITKIQVESKCLLIKMEQKKTVKRKWKCWNTQNYIEDATQKNT